MTGRLGLLRDGSGYDGLFLHFYMASRTFIGLLGSLGLRPSTWCLVLEVDGRFTTKEGKNKKDLRFDIRLWAWMGSSEWGGQRFTFFSFFSASLRL
jgi:hypothetical protein